MNHVALMGRLCGEPEIMTAQSGSIIAKYRLAVNRRFKKDGQPDADFLSCAAFGKSGEFAQKYLHKGTKIAVEGRIQTSSYEKDGVRHYTTEIIVEQHHFCESKQQAAAPGPDPNSIPASNGPKGYEQGITTSTGRHIPPEMIEIDEGLDDLPF